MEETPVNFQPIHDITISGLMSSLGAGEAGRKDRVQVESPFLGIASKEFVDTVAANENAFNAKVKEQTKELETLLSEYSPKDFDRSYKFEIDTGFFVLMAFLISCVLLFCFFYRSSKTTKNKCNVEEYDEDF